MATAVSADYPRPAPALFADSPLAASGTSPQAEISILKRALAEALPGYLKEGKKLPGSEEEYEKRFPPIDGGLEGGLKGAAETFYGRAKKSALNINKHTSEFYLGGYQEIFSIPNGISNIAGRIEAIYSGLKPDLENLLKYPPNVVQVIFKDTMDKHQEGFDTLRETAKVQKDNCARCIKELEKFKPIIEGDKKELDTVKTAYDDVVRLMQIQIDERGGKREGAEDDVRKIDQAASSDLSSARNDDTGAYAAGSLLFGALSRLWRERPEKQARVDKLKEAEEGLRKWETMLQGQEESMDGIRRTIDAAIAATVTIRGAYETMESSFDKISKSIKDFDANAIKTNPKFQKKGLGNLEDARKQWGEVLKQIDVFIKSRVYS